MSTQNLDNKEILTGDTQIVQDTVDGILVDNEKENILNNHEKDSSDLISRIKQAALKNNVDATGTYIFKILLPDVIEKLKKDVPQQVDKSIQEE